MTWAHRSLLFTLATALAACALPPPPDLDYDADPRDAEPDASIDAGIDAMPDAEPDSGLRPAQLQLNVDSHDFSDVTVGESTEPQEFFVQNVGETISGDISVAFSGAQAADYSFVSAGADDCDVGPLEPLQTCRVLVRFSPNAAGPRAATLTASSPMGGSDTISLTGNGLTAGDLELVTGASLTFDTTEIQATSATETITVRNTGESATAALTVILADEDNFEITSDGCGGQPLPSLGTCDVVVRFTPSEVGAWTTQLSVRESPTVGVSANLQATATARLTVTRTGSGAIVSDPAGLSCGAGCTSQTFSFDEPAVQLTATADSGHVFDGWTGACAAANPSNVCSVSLTTPLTTAGAAFRQVYPLVVTVSGEGTVTSAPAGISCGEGALDCDQTYDAGTPVTLSVTPADGWEVYAWSGTGTSCGAGVRMCSTTMNQARNVTVELRRQYLVMVMTGGSGAASGTVTGGGITCPGTCSTYAFENSMITLTESPGAQGGASQARFSGWGGACTGTATTCNLTITSATTVSATFVQQHRLALTLTGAGTGSVTAGANTCSGGTCNWYYDTGSTPSLSTAPGAGSLFAGFSGDCTGTSCSPSMTAPRAVTATFGVARALTVSVTGSGTVTSVPAGISCGADCTESYLDGTDVTLTVTPSAGWEVYDWGGAANACAAPSHTCTIDMTAALTATVELRRQWTVTVNTTGSGNGTVTAPGLSCTTPMTGCTKTVFEGDDVTLTQSQGTQGGASQSRFGGWSNACSGTGATCALNDIASDVTVNASSILQYRLAVSLTGTGGGTVTQGGNTCSTGTCNWYYDTGTTGVSLTATPNGASWFDGYAGDCNGSSCSLTMSAARTVNAAMRLMSCTPSTEVCNDATDHYVDCGPTGLIEREFDCPLECSSTSEKCMDVDPYDNNNATYDLYPYLAMSQDGPAFDFVGASSIDTSSGEVCVDANQNGIDDPSECSDPASVMLSGLRVFWFDSLSVAGTLTVRGSNPLVILVNDAVLITGTIDLAAASSVGGPGAQPGTALCTGGNVAAAAPGGGGAGRAFNGATGGAGGGSGGSGDLTPDPVVPLRGGCAGGYTGSAIARSYGGGGGGAIQLVSRTSITISGSGTIDASGGGGTSSSGVIDDRGGGGGGSGGAIVLEAPFITLSDSAVISTKGGGGAAVGHGSYANGHDGGTDAAPAPGGTNGALPAGGAGGTRIFGTSSGSSAAQPGSGASGSAGSGGGGAVGVARIATRNGTFGLTGTAAIRAYGLPATHGTREMD